MFREMLRFHQAMPEQECIALLQGAKRGVLSVLGDDGYPYGMPMNHYYCPEDGKLYFHGGMQGHKIDALRRCGKASFCVTDSGTPGEDGWLRFCSVVAFGTVEFVTDHDRAMEVSRLLSRKFTCDEAYIEDEVRRAGPRTLCFALTVEHLTGKRVTES
ncbi:MAG: pyridoxamine 5'-phosphate oxidase family protein [Oscillospiraceae bacterium]|nr:pyridoxamine 5'-phosphate oxidase family protein [Oscillospiraceae bacterium]